MGIRASSLGIGFIPSKEGNIIGINLGHDYYSEHEYGIMSLQKDFGLRLNGKYGFDARKNRIVPEGLFYKDNIFGYPKELLEYIVRDELLSIGPTGIGSAWCEHSFAVSVAQEYSGIINVLYGAFNSKNGVIMLSGRNNPFANRGMVLLDYRLIPEDTKDEFYERDKKYHKEQALFRKLEKKSGIFGLAKENGKKYFSLHIGKLDENGEPLWWLNAGNESGWYNTEGLRQWAESKDSIKRS